MREKQALAQEVKQRYQAASREDKKTILGEFIPNTTDNRKYALRVLNKKTVGEVLLRVDGETVKLKPTKPKARLGKKIYGDEVIASLRLIWIFFWNKCGRQLVAADFSATDAAADALHGGLASPPSRLKSGKN
jgi:hypothetical protein